MWGLVGGLAIIVLGRVITRAPSNKPIAFLFSVLAALVAYAFGFRIEFLTNPQGGFFYLTWLSLPLTLLWIVTVSGALSFLDSDDKLLTSVGFIVCLSFLLISLLQAPSVPFAVTLTLAALTMLIVMRFSSARLSLASRELGFVIALISIAGVLKAPASLAIITPVLMLGVPVMTTSFSIAYGRAMENPFIAFFAKRGYSQKTAIFLIYLVMSYVSVSLVLLAKFTNMYTFALVLGAAATTAATVFWGRENILRGGFEADANAVYLFGIPINKLSLTQTVDKLEEFIACQQNHIVCTPDTSALMRAQWDAKLRAVYQSADLVTADGTGLVWASRFLSAPLSERVAGIDVVYELCRRANQKGSKPHVARGDGYKLFLLGARPSVAQEAAQRLMRDFPNLKVVGTHHGYFSEAENERIISEINASAPDVLLLWMVVPKLVLWIMQHKAKLHAHVIMGVGGSFDVISGRISRAPKVWQRAGLEWAYRILIEPRRLWRARLILFFIWKVLLLKLMVSFESQPATVPSFKSG